MANSKLQMPANYMALNESEMSCVEGGGIISQVCYAFGRMFRSTYYDKWESESKTLEKRCIYLLRWLYPHNVWWQQLGLYQSR